MKCTKLEISNISELAINHNGFKHVLNPLTTAYNIIFDTKNAYITMLTEENLIQLIKQ